VVVPVSLFFVRAPAHPGYPGSKGRKTLVYLFIHRTAGIYFQYSDTQTKAKVNVRLQLHLRRKLKFITIPDVQSNAVTENHGFTHTI